MKDLVDTIDDALNADGLDRFEFVRGEACPICNQCYAPFTCKRCGDGEIVCICGYCSNPDCELSG